MGRINLRERIKQGLLLLDGAMGTQLIARGIEAGTCNDYLNIESPDIVFDVHRAYIEAGSDAVITNTFGANKFALARHGFGEKSEEINGAAARIARKAAGEEKYVLGDIGPSGDFLEPLGSLKREDLKEAFAIQAKGLSAGGVDGFIIETMTALDEVTIAVEAVKSVSELAIFVSLSYDAKGEQFRTMMGVGPIDAIEQIVPLGIDAIGFNCGSLSLEQYVRLAEFYASEIKDNIVLLAEPNAGRPELVDGEVTYNVLPKDFAAAAEKIYSAGAKIIGGCCGTGPEHIKEMSQLLKEK